MQAGTDVNDVGGRPRLIAVLLLAVTAIALALSPESAVAQEQPAPATVWLCAPHVERNPCTGDLTTTVRRKDGTSRLRADRPARRPPVDCFYVYPTVSEQPTTVSDLTVDPQQIGVAERQAAPFSRTCRVFAPMYRQVTLATIRGTAPPPTAADRELGYTDVRNAWREYLREHNRGRGVVLVGHSQGTGLLARLAQDEIDDDAAARQRLVSALLIGGRILVPAGQDVGGTFVNVPACRSATQLRCVIAYNAFLSTPPPNSRFGRAPEPGQEVLCTNPASLSGGTGVLRPSFTTRPYQSTIPGPPPPRAPTPWVSFPGALTGTCARDAGASWLQVDVARDAQPSLPALSHQPDETWGLHVVDLYVAMDDLTDVVRRQADVFVAQQRREAEGGGG